MIWTTPIPSPAAHRHHVDVAPGPIDVLAFLDPAQPEIWSR